MHKRDKGGGGGEVAQEPGEAGSSRLDYTPAGGDEGGDGLRRLLDAEGQVPSYEGQGQAPEWRKREREEWVDGERNRKSRRKKTLTGEK